MKLRSLFYTYLPAEAREEDLAGLVPVLQLLGDLEEGRAALGGVPGLQEPSPASAIESGGPPRACRLLHQTRDQRSREAPAQGFIQL